MSMQRVTTLPHNDWPLSPSLCFLAPNSRLEIANKGRNTQSTFDARKSLTNKVDPFSRAERPGASENHALLGAPQS